MNKKQLTAVIEGIVESVQANSGLTESEARTLVGVAIKKLTGDIVAATGYAPAAVAA